MSYQSGNMGIAEAMAIVFAVTFVPVFQSIWSITIDQAKSAAWMIPCINGLITGSVFFLLLYVMEKVPGDLLDVSRKLLGSPMAKLIGLVYFAHFYIESALLLREFSENTLLTALPYLEFSVAILFYSLVAAVILYLGIEPLARASYIVMPVIVFAVLFVVVFLYPKFIVLQLTPWQGPGIEKVLINGTWVSGFNFGLLLLPILARSLHDVTTIRYAALYGFGLSVVMRIVMVLGFTLVFGSGTGREKMLPFFEMTRAVYVSRYLQRIESLFILLWVVAGIIAIAVTFYVSIYIITRLVDLPTYKPLIFPTILSAAQLAMLPPDITSVLLLHGNLVTTWYNIGSLGVPLLIFIAFFVRRKGVKTWSSGS
ncbi:GerAB/ArcD/ProY family transporter [Sporomusa malonica]|uniref:Spore germination protein (Amino acid permease) n=1 Tax=Sporomusa malonica TaxID=112901 RepID=A0A1W2EFH4_9FIRM|nr:GerAB/ArcD/ProY family transporter [Sporomusa malonica]SMD07838.1 spore germination protein (amino acid permease) [Sporomusa malonica]